MKQAHLLKMARKILGDQTRSLGFEYERSAFYRELASGVIHIMAIGLDVRSTDSFFVMCGLNSRLISPEKAVIDMGFFGHQHLTARGWDRNSGCWPCGDETSAIASLERIRVLFDDLVEPWFKNHCTLSDVAVKMDNYPVPQAQLFKADGDFKRARQSLEAYLVVLSKPNRWDDPKHVEASKRLAQAMLSELATV